MKLHQLRVVLAICERIRAGEQLNEICASGSVTLASGRKIKLPAIRTVEKWITKKEFEPIYREAFDWATDVMGGKCTEITNEVAARIKGKFPIAEVAAAKLQVEHQRWLMARRNPKKYGDGPQVAINNTLTQNSATVVITDEKRQELIARHRRLLAETDK